MSVCSISMDAKTIRTRLQELAFLNSKATIWYKASSAKQAPSASSNGNGAAPAESAEGGWEKLHYSGGLREYVQFLNQDNSPMHEPIFIREEVSSVCLLLHHAQWIMVTVKPCTLSGAVLSARVMCLLLCASVSYAMRLWSRLVCV